MAVKSIVKSKAKPKAKPKVKARIKVKAKVKTASVAKAKVVKKPKVTVKPKAAKTKTVKPITVKAKVLKPASKVEAKPKIEKIVAKPVSGIAIPKPTPRFQSKSASTVKSSLAISKRILNPTVDRKPVKRAVRLIQYSYMKAPGAEHAFEVGDTVEVFCDHDKSRERIRGWVKGIVVQVDYKMVAVQFRSNVYLTDGWMVPDRILWYPLNSEHIRPVPGRKQVKKEFIPEY